MLKSSQLFSLLSFLFFVVSSLILIFLSFFYHSPSDSSYERSVSEPKHFLVTPEESVTNKNEENKPYIKNIYNELDKEIFYIKENYNDLNKDKVYIKKIYKNNKIEIFNSISINKLDPNRHLLNPY